MWARKVSLYIFRNGQWVWVSPLGVLSGMGFWVSPLVLKDSWYSKNAENAPWERWVSSKSLVAFENVDICLPCSSKCICRWCRFVQFILTGLPQRWQLYGIILMTDYTSPLENKIPLLACAIIHANWIYLTAAYLQMLQPRFQQYCRRTSIAVILFIGLCLKVSTQSCFFADEYLLSDTDCFRSHRKYLNCCYFDSGEKIWAYVGTKFASII